MAIRAQFTTPYGRAAFGSVGAGFADLLNATKDMTGRTLNGMVTVIMIDSTLNTDVDLALDGLDTPAIRVKANQARVIDLNANDMTWSGVIRVRHSGVAPTSGDITVEVVRGNF
jgi:hypothetical protein